mmetsp:Transcript_36158/g.90751  ORF Transcript_36158/g.90751 Transcript_36158/m.90751 type:complete len:419 (-) Transcript_36158:1292-2548(-)
MSARTVNSVLADTPEAIRDFFAGFEDYLEKEVPGVGSRRDYPGAPRSMLPFSRQKFSNVDMVHLVGAFLAQPPVVQDDYRLATQRYNGCYAAVSPGRSIRTVAQLKSKWERLVRDYHAQRNQTGANLEGIQVVVGFILASVNRINQVAAIQTDERDMFRDSEDDDYSTTRTPRLADDDPPSSQATNSDERERHGTPDIAPETAHTPALSDDDDAEAGLVNNPFADDEDLWQNERTATPRLEQDGDVSRVEDRVRAAATPFALRQEVQQRLQEAGRTRGSANARRIMSASSASGGEERPRRRQRRGDPPVPIETNSSVDDTFAKMMYLQMLEAREERRERDRIRQQEREEKERARQEEREERERVRKEERELNERKEANRHAEEVARLQESQQQFQALMIALLTGRATPTTMAPQQERE